MMIYTICICMFLNERWKKEASKVNKQTRQSNTAHPRQHVHDRWNATSAPSDLVGPSVRLGLWRYFSQRPLSHLYSRTQHNVTRSLTSRRWSAQITYGLRDNVTWCSMYTYMLMRDAEGRKYSKQNKQQGKAIQYVYCAIDDEPYTSHRQWVVCPSLQSVQSLAATGYGHDELLHDDNCMH